MKKRKKEWIACMLSMVMALSSFNSVVFAQENENANTIQPSSDQNPAMYPLSTMAASVETTFEADGINYCVTGNDPNTVSVIPLDKAEYEGKVDIPETVQYDGTDYTVTSIGAEAFGESTLVTAIVIPDTVTSIGINAFGGCTALQSLYISGNVTDGLGGAMTGLWGRDYTISYEVPDWPNVKVTFGEGSPYEIDGGVLYNGTVAEAALDYHAKTIRIREGTTEIADVAFNFPFNEGSYLL